MNHYSFFLGERLYLFIKESVSVVYLISGGCYTVFYITVIWKKFTSQVCRSLLVGTLQWRTAKKNFHAEHVLSPEKDVTTILTSYKLAEECHFCFSHENFLFVRDFYLKKTHKRTMYEDLFYEFFLHS